MIELATFLEDVGIEPAAVLAFRHRPWEAKFRNVLAWLAEGEPDLYNLYQSTHGPRTEAALSRAKFVASFVGHHPGKALFVGLYEVGGFGPADPAASRANAGLQRLVALGMDHGVLDHAGLLFDLRPVEALTHLKGKLVVAWPEPDRSWYRWADRKRNRFALFALHEESLLVRAMPDWDRLVLTHAEVSALPMSWAERLGQWRGIYIIFDASDGMRYIGSAYGADNILGRWKNYAASGHGGNVLLRSRPPQHFQFSILQRVSPDMPADEVIALENRWKDRVHSREPWGLNAN